MKLALRMGLIGLLLGLFGCDRAGELQAGKSTADEVRQKMGKPVTVWREGNDEVWEYPFTPQGTRNYMVVIGPDHVVKRIDQVLTEANFAQIRPGMSRSDVRRLLGRPASVQSFPALGEEVWDWKMPTPFDAEARFNVHFDAGGVVVRASKSEQSR